MDSRFPSWLRFILAKLDFLAIPNLAPLVVGLIILGFVGQNILGASFDRFVFDPVLVLQGEWWRIFAFPVAQGGSDPIWLLFECMWMYFLVNSLEEQWGPGPLTIYMIFGYAMCVVASFLTLIPVPIWYYLMFNITFAASTLFPDYQMMLFFILPVKMKWMGWVFGAWFGYKFLLGSNDLKIILFLCFSPYLVFFLPLLYQSLKNRSRLAKHKKRFDQDMWR
mgnify:CR=1 FL=1